MTSPLVTLDDHNDIGVAYDLRELRLRVGTIYMLYDKFDILFNDIIESVMNAVSGDSIVVLRQSELGPHLENLGFAYGVKNQNQYVFFNDVIPPFLWIGRQLQSINIEANNRWDHKFTIFISNLQSTAGNEFYLTPATVVYHALTSSLPLKS